MRNLANAMGLASLWCFVLFNPVAAWGQGLLPSNDRLNLETEIEFTYSGFNRESGTGATDSIPSTIQQEEQTLGARLGIGASVFYIEANAAKSQYGAEASTLRQDTETTTQYLRLNLTWSEYWRPYAGTNYFSRNLVLYDDTIATTFDSYSEFSDRYYGSAFFLPFFDGLTPFFEIAQGQTKVAMHSDITNIPIVRERYEATTRYYELGLIVEKDKNYKLLLSAKRKEMPMVEGVQYNMEKSLAHAEQVRIGIAMGKDSGITLGYFRSVNERRFTDLSAYAEDEVVVSAEYQASKNWYIRISQNQSSQYTEFLLASPSERSENQFISNALTVAFRF